MSKERFEHWFENLIRIWVAKNPNKVADMVAEKFIWYETPFDQPLTTKVDLLKEWQTILDQEEISVIYEIYSIEGDLAIAHWHASFTRVLSQEKAELDGIYKVVLDSEGKCTEFRQWYNLK